jgi:DNA-directed RNA polymerase subunit beta
VSEKLIKEDYYTSIHIEEFETRRATQNWARRITRYPERQRKLARPDESGIIRWAPPSNLATLGQGDRVKPAHPEEKLLRAIW